MNFNPYKLYNCLSDKHSSLGEKFLFVYLTRHLVPDLIMDIGSRDGSDALNFKQFNPNAEVIAIEANPTLFEKMSDNQQLSEHGVKIFNLAATNTNGTATFSIFNEKKGRAHCAKEPTANSGNIIFLRKEISGKLGFFFRLMEKKMYFRIAHKLKSIFN